ncbi:NADPH-dependent 7-cyano-7-deazaguanine reductase QueF [Paludibacterium purpuratum]|uniref:NADPH-dependent 7-cyano-7-deazaguanine reductase n=1 Tax=Paludibacterium purpuratum TaxID=1144873 RepID=A0A4R7BCQ9_9NEIS|nr:NADPH-dependent 7-cyano-7-deazaguanine reductase QueF [Paludibacterium purpuratum]TDR81397.1 7-cyano-7-deazaguanine reductase [Paludibacterium purpuratum]
MTTQQPEHSPLGKKVDYQDHYDPTLLFPIPRRAKREEIGVDEAALPFAGCDIWNGYELSWLNARGKPQIAIATIVIPAESPSLIESKSFKLYLNTFNQTRLDNDQAVIDCLTRDLSHAAGAQVLVTLTRPAAFVAERFAELPGESIDELDIAVDDYSPDPSRLTAHAGDIVEETLCSDLLKSNCLVTGQPDWGSVTVHYRGARIDREGLLRYLIGFRQHNEFHEQCVERIFVDLLRQCRPEVLTVYARYTRRGGLDINPWRSNDPNASAPVNLRTARQ